MKVDVDKVDEKYRFLCKEDMKRSDIQQLGYVIFRDKLENLKNRILGLFRHEKK